MYYAIIRYEKSNNDNTDPSLVVIVFPTGWRCNLFKLCAKIAV